MPIGDYPAPLTERPPEEEGWHQLAQEAVTWPEDHEGLQQLRENHVNRLLGEKGLSHLIVSKEDKAGARFLHKHGNLNQREVTEVVGYLRKNGTTIPDNAGIRTAAYLDFMGDGQAVNDGILTGDEDSIARQVEAHVIDANDVPESHFVLLQRINREQGRGDIEISDDMRQQHIEAIQADQRGSLNKWVEYLGGEDGSYPNWFKRYTWDSMVRLGSYDKEAEKFNKREADTIAPYPELNREALAYVYDAVKKFHVLGEKIDDTKLKQLLNEGSFGRLYAHAFLEVTPDSPERRQEVRGSWTQFRQTDDSRTMRRLSGSLQGHGTGWCIAGESIATKYLSQGDFYVYYTRDEDGKDTVPRVAIRMQDRAVAEVRGVLPAQELEPTMTDIVAEKLQGLPGGESYIIKSQDMKRLTALDNLLAESPEVSLSAEDVAFLYGLDHPIEGFGYEDDPRVRELQLKVASNYVADILERLDAPAEAVELIRHHVRIHELVEKAIQRPDEAFSDDELCFIYGLNGPIETFNPKDTDRLAKTVDSLHEGRDRERLLELIPEALSGQFETSFSACEDVTKLLGVEAPNKELIKEAFDTKLESWRKENAYDYILEQLIEYDTQFNLIATPNILASYEQIARVAMGENQSHPARINGKVYSQYSAEQLSGELVEGLPIRFKLMPSKSSSEIGKATVDQQRSALSRLQQQSPQLTLEVPSVLDNVTYWQTLRVSGGKLTTAKTLIRHFNLPENNTSSSQSVPRSFVGDDGLPYFFGSTVADAEVSRVAIG